LSKVAGSLAGWLLGLVVIAGPVALFGFGGLLAVWAVSCALALVLAYHNVTPPRKPAARRG
jgi:hypothetical protein